MTVLLNGELAECTNVPKVDGRKSAVSPIPTICKVPQCPRAPRQNVPVPLRLIWLPGPLYSCTNYL